MATAQDIKDRTFAFACQIVRLYREMNKLARCPPGIARQLLHSGTAIGANIEESRASSSRKDMASRVSVALREARETKYWLRLIRATELAPADALEGHIKEADELVAILTVSVRRLRAGVTTTREG